MEPKIMSVEDSLRRRIAELEAQVESFDAVDKARQAENAALGEKVERLEKNYHDLLYQVATKHPNETRHETAKRYIQQAENQPERAEAALQEGE